MEKLKEIDIHEFGTQIQIAGMLMQNNDITYAIMLPKSDENLDIEKIKVTHDEWKGFLHQIDTLEVKLFPHQPGAKVVVRKTQRNIEQQVSWNVYRRDNFRCRYCGDDKVAMTVDHIVLWENMGASVEDNLLCACSKCNRTRGNMLYEDWLKSDYYKKVINFGHWEGPSDRHQQNVDAGLRALKVPLRISKRNR